MMKKEAIIKENFVEQNCPVCGTDNKMLLYENIFHTCNVLKKSNILISNEDVPSNINLCRNCGHKYLSKVLNDDVLKYYYGVAESEYYDSVVAKPHDRIPNDTKRYADLIEKKCIGGKSVLEIGSGMGFLLYQLKLKGFDCTGVEPSNFASSYSRSEFGLNVLTGILDYETFYNRKFDIIILNDVVEHISDINSLFNLMKFYLSPNGYVFILTGDSNSLYAKICRKKWLYFFSWEHVSFFNRTSLKYLFSNHSLKMHYFKKTRHSSSYFFNWKTFILTFRGILANKLGFRKHKFFYMAFDHLVAIGKNINNK